jgi:hypothetical protein
MAKERELVTTFVPIRSLEDYTVGEGTSSMGQVSQSVVGAVTPGQSRKRAFLRLMKKQEGRETLLVSAEAA